MTSGLRSSLLANEVVLYEFDSLNNVVLDRVFRNIQLPGDLIVRQTVYPAQPKHYPFLRGQFVNRFIDEGVVRAVA